MGRELLRTTLLPNSFEQLFQHIVFQEDKIQLPIRNVYIDEFRDYDNFIFVILNTLKVSDKYSDTELYKCETNGISTPLWIRLLIDTCKYNRTNGCILRFKDYIINEKKLALILYALNICPYYEDIICTPTFCFPPPAKFRFSHAYKLLDIVKVFDADSLQLQKDLDWTRTVEDRN